MRAKGRNSIWRSAILILVLVQLLGCSGGRDEAPSRASASSAPHSDSPSTTNPRGPSIKVAVDDGGYCGGELAAGEINRYASAIASVLQDPQSLNEVSRLYDEDIDLSVGGKMQTIRSQELEAYRDSLPTKDDWAEIRNRILAGKLQSVGWRGCILSSGKVAFQTDEAGHLHLYAFDLDRAWR